MTKENSNNTFALLDYLDQLVEKLRNLVPKAVKEGDIDAVHDARVATRRLKAAMELLEPVLPGKQSQSFGKIGKSLRRRLGPLRDADVMLEHLSGIRHPGFAHAVAWMSGRLTQARRKAIDDAQDDLPPARVLARLGSWWGLHAELAGCAEAMDSLLAESVHLQIDAFSEQAKLLAQERTDEEKKADRRDPHQLRISGKSLRYTLEMAREHGRPLPKSVMWHFKKVQESLGLWHDYVVLTERLLRESTDDLLAHHDGELQKGILQLAAYTLGKSQTQLRHVLNFWKKQGEKLMDDIREIFPLTHALPELQTPEAERSSEAIPTSAPDVQSAHTPAA